VGLIKKERDMNTIEKIIIDDGATFEGTVEMFQDCFFSNAYPNVIEDWAWKNNMKCEIIYKKGKQSPIRVNQIPGMVIDGYHVDWKITTSAFGCYNHYDGRCQRTDKPCGYENYPLKVEDSFSEIKY